MHNNFRLLDILYRSLAARDAAGMAACHHPQVHLTDPVFDLRAAGVARTAARSLARHATSG